VIAELRAASLTRDDRPVLREVSLRVRDGERLALVGPNGAGKTSIVRLLAGLETPTGGECRHVPRGCGYLPQAVGASLFPWFSVLRNVCLLGASRERGLELLAAFTPGLDSSRRAGSLSGGEQQLVALARALAADGPAVIADEPFSALAPAARAHALTVVDSLLGRRALVLVTHQPHDAKALGARVLEVANGAITEVGP